MSVLRHATPSLQRGDHLIHRLAVCDRTTCGVGTNLNGRIFSFHLQNLTVEAAVPATPKLAKGGSAPESKGHYMHTKVRLIVTFVCDTLST